MKRKNYERTADGRYRGVVYKYTNRTTQRSYIGETANEKVRRNCWKKPKDNAYAGNKIAEARKMFGVTDWDYYAEEIIAASPEELDRLLTEKQKEWIVKYDSINNGYNSSYGDGMEGRQHTSESKALISKNHRRYQSDEAKEKISSSNLGRKLSEETKAKISAGNKGKKRSAAQKQAQSMRKKGIEPKAASEGLKEYIAANGHGPTKGIKQSVQARANMKAAQQKNGISVIAIDSSGNEQVYPTMLDAAKACGLNVGSVASAIKTGGTTRNGFKFKSK